MQKAITQNETAVHYIFTTSIEPLLVKILINMVIKLPDLDNSLSQRDPDPDEAGAFVDDMNLMTQACSNTLHEVKNIFGKFPNIRTTHEHWLNKSCYCRT